MILNDPERFTETIDKSSERVNDLFDDALDAAFVKIERQKREFSLDELTNEVLRELDFDGIVYDDDLIRALTQQHARHRVRSFDTSHRNQANKLKKEMDARLEIPPSFMGFIPTAKGNRILLRDATLEHLNFWHDEKRENVRQALQVEGGLFEVIQILTPYLDRGYRLHEAYDLWRRIAS